MDLIPKPDQVVSAAANLAQRVLSGGLADLRPMPRTLIDDGAHRELYHYRPAGEALEEGDPVLLVTPLAAPALCYDLRRGCSLVEHLVGTGRPTYLVEYGEVAFRDRSLGMEQWIGEVVPRAIEETSRHAGGRRVHVTGWSLGGTFALLTAADRPELPIASLAVLGSPFDVQQVPLVAPLRPLVDLDLDRGRGMIKQAYQLTGGVPNPLVTWAAQLSSFRSLVTKPVALATRLDDAEFLAQVEAVDRFTANMAAYPGRSFGQLYHRFVKANELLTGTLALADRTISVADVTAPVLVVAGAGDGIAPVAAVKAVVPLLTGSADVRFEIVPGGHLGLLTGRAARGSTWEVLDEWLEQWSSAGSAEEDDMARTTKEPPAVTKPRGKKSGKAKPDARQKPAAKRPGGKKEARVKKAARVEKSSSETTVATTKSVKASKAVASGKVVKPAKAGKPLKAKSGGKASGGKVSGGKAKAPSPGVLGTNPSRRYGSGGSRSLAR